MTVERLTDLSKVDKAEEKSDILNVSQAMSEFNQHEDPLGDNFAVKVNRPFSNISAKKKKPKKDRSSPKPRLNDADKNSTKNSQKSFSKLDTKKSDPKNSTSKSKL